MIFGDPSMEETKEIPLDKSKFEVEKDKITFSVNKVEKKKIDKLISAQEAFDLNMKHLQKYDTATSEDDFVGLGKVLFNSITKEYENKKFVQSYAPGPISAIEYAFRNHQHLTLSPSDFIILIGQGLSTHINLNAEKLRKHFVNHEGKKTIEVKVNKIDFQDENFSQQLFDEFSKEIDKRIKKEVYDIVIDDTSVATHTTKIVSQLNLMDSMKAYFEYQIMCICGFPQITLLGTPEDWQKLKNKAHKLKEMNGKDNCLELDWWLKNLVPVVDKLCEAGIDRKIDFEFWSNLYQESRVYGGGNLAGWINAFLPYYHDDKKNYCLESGFEDGYVYSNGIDPQKIKEGISEIPFIIKDLAGNEHKRLFYFGQSGVIYDKENDSVKTAYFWLVSKPLKNKKIIQKKNIDEDEGSLF